MSVDNRLISAADLAQLLNLTKSTVLSWRRLEGLPGELILNRYSAGSYYFRYGGVTTWLAKNKPHLYERWGTVYKDRPSVHS